MTSHFDYYLQHIDEFNLHEKNCYMKKMPNEIKDLNNLIIYGPPGCGKYSQTLNIIRKYSHSGLKYEKKINYTNIEKKQDILFKISDIHYEIDLNLLGCNSKLIWHDLFNKIVDIILTKSDNYGIILCKNFHNINSDLLDVFYSYMQNNNNLLKIKFILITEQISFIPSNILKCSSIINISRPTKSNYNKISNIKSGVVLNNIKNINNIKHDKLLIHNNNIPNIILNQIKNYEKIKFGDFRDKLYDILIYNIDIYETIWYILYNLIKSDLIPDKKFSDVLLKTHSFLRYFNNNYRPIYHLENYTFYLISVINDFK